MVATQGGEIARWNEKENGYTLSGLWVFVEDWQEICAERGTGEAYFLSVRTLCRSPLPEPLKANHPPRAEVKCFPSRCPLQELMSEPPSELIVEGASSGEDAVAVQGDLQILSAKGTRFNISTSVAVLGDIVISSRR